MYLKKSIRILIGTGCCVLVLISWVITVNIKPVAEKQLVLIDRATALINDGIYIRALPLLEEAAGLNSIHTRTAEEKLKGLYLLLNENNGFSRKYTSLLDKQINRNDAEPYMFIEAANYYLGISKQQDALIILKTGMEKTGDTSIKELYESSRYQYEISRTVYENTTAIFEKTIQVQNEGKWGIAAADGTLIIPCDYDKISTFSKDRAVVMNSDITYAVDKNNNRIAIIHEEIFDFTNLAENRIAILFENGWRRATGEFAVGSSRFEAIGMYSQGYAAAKVNGKWGVIDIFDNWLIPAEYEEIVKDELGRCYAQNALFVRSGDFVYLFTNGAFFAEAYEDARPFSDEGYAAVKKNGKWGFIDNNGTEVIAFIYDDALSFGQHLAAVKLGEYWGYISLYGHLVIDTEFFDAKSFSGGSAPVLTDRGWQFITLLEYKKGTNLL